MAKITFIGAGSIVFTRHLIRDLLTFPLLEGATIVLMDINAERLEFARKSAMRIIQDGKYPAKVITTMDRREALKGADFVIISILCGDTSIWRYDIEIPKAYGIDINVGDTRGPSGIFRFLRTYPVMQDICKDMEELCPSATMLNYTNPMAMLCRAMSQKTFVRLTGLCHSVQGTAKMLAKWIGAPYDEIDYRCAGINHMAWYLEYKWKGADAYPLIYQAISTGQEVYNEEIVRNEMYLALGYYVTESSGHASEYNPWFRKRQDLIEKYCIPGTGWNPGEHAYILNEYRRLETEWKDEVKQWYSPETPVDLTRGEEYAAYIMNALTGGEPFCFNGNVPNTGIVTNLPVNACVEVPVWVSRKGFEPVHVGALPPSVVGLTGLSAQIEEMAVEGCLTGDPTLIYQAILYDPLTSAVLSLGEIRKMVNQMFEQNRDYLGYFKRLKI